MAAINTLRPALDFNPVNNCMLLGFTSDRYEGTGTPASIIIPYTQLSLLDVDSSVCFNGVTWTFAAAADSDSSNNVLPFSVLANITQSIVSAIRGNGFFGNSFTSANVFSDAAGINIIMPDCKNNAEFTLKNLPDDASGEVQDIVIKDSPEILELPVNYSIGTFFKCDGEEIEGIKECGINIEPRVIIDCEECGVDSYEIKKDISGFLCGCVKTPFPSFDSNNLINYLPGRTASITWSFYEKIGSPINSLENNRTSPFSIINYAYQDNDFDSFLQVLNPSPHPDGTQLMTSYESDDKVCVSQHNWVHFIYNHDDTPTNVTMIVSFETSSGTVSGSTFVLPIDDKDGDVLEIQTGLQNLVQYATDAGVDICDVKRYTVFIREQTSAGIVNYPISYNVEQCGCSSTFMFLSTQGVYETICLNCPTQVDIEVIREFCDACEPCNVSALTKKKEIIGMQCSEVFSVPFKPLSFYNERIMKEFLCSTDVYYCQDGEFYSIEPMTAQVADYVRRGTPNNFYQFRINDARPLFN